MYEAGIRANYHESSDCFNFEYPPKSLLTHQATKKKLPKFSYPKKSRNRKFKPKKIVRPSALSLEIRSTPRLPMAACSIPANFFPVKWDWDLRDFCLVMDGISEIVQATSKDFRRFSEDFRKRRKMFRRTLTTSEAIWLKDDNLSVFWFRWDMQSHHSMPYWNIFMEIELNFRRLFGFVSQAWEIFRFLLWVPEHRLRNTIVIKDRKQNNSK